MLGQSEIIEKRLATLTFFDVLFVILAISMFLGGCESINNSIKETKLKPAFYCVFGLTPIYAFAFNYWLLFTQTEWAYQNPSLVCILLIPCYSLMCSRQIVCNVTQMDCDSVPKTFLWFLLFPLNRRAAVIFRK